MLESGRVFGRGAIAAIAGCYLASTVILWVLVGPWEAVRHGLVNALLALSWLAAAGYLLRGLPRVPFPAPRRPRLELLLLLVGLLSMMGVAALRYGGWLDLPDVVYYLVSYGLVVAVVLSSGQGLRGLGLTLAPGRAWLAVLVVILLNVAAAVLFLLLPAGEGATAGGQDLSQQLPGPLPVLLLLASILFRAALPEELVLRVGIQPRLAAFVPIGGAIVVQALLFSAGHLPQELLAYDRPLLLSLGYLLSIENGLIAGYFWYRTRSLPLLLLLHLFAFSRFGI
jgi:membrane protease YdiL (CAAX protease family)